MENVTLKSTGMCRSAHNSGGHACSTKWNITVQQL